MAKAGDVLKFKPVGPSVEEARKRMIEAGEAPKGELGRRTAFAPAPAGAEVIAQAGGAGTNVVDVLEPEFAEEPENPKAAPLPRAEKVEVSQEPAAQPVQATPESGAAPAATQPAATEPARQPKVERLDTEQFTSEIRQEDGSWVGEIRYKSGAGTEKFIAHTKDELMLELLKGKGSATLRVREAVRREKLGGPKLDRAYQLPEGITAEKFEAMDEDGQSGLLYEISQKNAALFALTHPEYYGTPKNAEAFHAYLGEHKLPITVRNLEYAYEDLLDSGLLELKPSAGPQVSESAVPISRTNVPVSVTASSQPPPARAAEGPAVAPGTGAGAVQAAQPAAAPPAVIVRKRGTSGLQPEQSSEPSETEASNAAGKVRELSMAELRHLPPAELKRLAYADREARKGTRSGQ